MDAAQVTRRSVLAMPVALGVLAACGTGGTDGTDGTSEESTMAERLTYGDDPSQWADLQRPDGPSRGVVVVIHGGFWKAEYDASLGRPLAEDLTRRGWTTLNVEYRRVGNGGGYPQTFDDVAAAIDLLATTDVDTGTVVALGHSAGGHLAAWAAARGRFDEWRDGVGVTHVVSQAGVVDLTTAHDDDLGDGAVRALMGAGPDDPSYDLADPARQLPLEAPVWCVHAADDPIVPLSQSTTYVEKARAAGAAAELVEGSGGHFGVIETDADAWAAIVDVLDGIG
jgi:acetyl esterase/lipase